MMKKTALFLSLILFAITAISQNQVTLLNKQKIAFNQGGFTGGLKTDDYFGFVKAIGDVDGDNIEDLAVGAPWDDDGGIDHGAVWILLMNENRTVKSNQKISSTQGNFAGIIDSQDRFGLDIAPIGDFNHDGTADIAVGAFNDDDGGINSGAVWFLFLNSNGSVKSHKKISGLSSNILAIGTNHQFGMGLCSLGDLDGDGIIDIAVGAPTYDDDGGLYRGCVNILFLNSDGTVKSQKLINDYQGGFSGDLDDEDRFGASIANLGDINGDGTIDIAVHALYDDDGAMNAGAIYILFLNTDGTTKKTQKISALDGGFKGSIKSDDHFGSSLSYLGDIDGNGVNDLLTSSYLSDDGGSDRGKAWILFLNNDGSVKDYKEINSQNSLLANQIDNNDHFGVSVSVFSKLKNNSQKEIIIGSRGDDDGATNAGAFYIFDIEVEKNTLAPISSVRKISATESGKLPLKYQDKFGISSAVIGDLDGDGVDDLAVGAYYDDDGSINGGAVYILFMNEDKTVKSYQKISSTFGNFTGKLDAEDIFGRSITALGDLDKDGVIDIAVGNWGDDDNVTNSGAVWILFLKKDGTVKSFQKISATQGGFVGLTPNRGFGTTVCSIGDINEDGNTDIAIGSPNYDDDGGLYRGCIWIVCLNSNGTVKSQQKINDKFGGFTNKLDDEDFFGYFIENIGDFNGDGVTDIAVNSLYDDDGVYNAGAFYLLFLNKNGTVNASQKISATSGGFSGSIASEDRFGMSISNLGDIDNDGMTDLMVSASGSDEYGTDKGKVWILLMNKNGTVKDNYSLDAKIPEIKNMLDLEDRFGIATSSFPKLNSKGKKELIVTAFQDDDGAKDAGALFILDLDAKYILTANAGIDKTVAENTSLTLSGSAPQFQSTKDISFKWTAPAGIMLNSTEIAQPTLILPEVIKDSILIFQLAINNGTNNSLPDTLLIKVTNVNNAPKGDAGLDQTINEGSLVTLDGSASLDSDNNTLSYSWSAPYVIQVNSTTAQKPTFWAPEVTTDTDFVFTLLVNDGMVSSLADQVKITVKQVNKAPVANAGADQEVNEGSTVTLDGYTSNDADGQSLTYYWTAPAGIQLNSVTTQKPTFLAPEVAKDTEFVFTLIVNDGIANSSADQIKITVKQVNKAPIANAGIDQTLNEGLTVTLDGSTSTDADGQSLTYSWTAPVGILLNSPTSQKPTFLAPEVAKDKEFIFTLIVNDGEASSVADLVKIIVKQASKAPIANAGSAVGGQEGSVITLNGSASSDADGDALFYKWTAPVGITLSSTTEAKPTFVAPDVLTNTEYTFKLVVNDGKMDSEMSQVVVVIYNNTFVNKIPFANAGQDQIVEEGALVTLDGLKSSDLDGTELSYLWTPPSGLLLSSLISKQPTFIAPEVKTDTDFVFTLRVNDGLDNSEEDQVVITVKQINKKPVAVAGPDQTIDEGGLVTLNGLGSFDDDNDNLSYLWLSPDGITLSSGNVASPSFTAPEVTTDKEFIFTLVVNDGKINSSYDEVKVLVKHVNKIPVANAVSIIGGSEGSLITLDASASTDGDGDVLSYKWIAPNGITLSSSSEMKPTFIAPSVNENTEFIFKLIVSDGFSESTEAKVSVVITKPIFINTLPTANAGADQFANEGNEVQLDGSMSFDKDGQLLTFSWIAPTGIELSNIHSTKPTFKAPEVIEDTDYIFTLIVNDGFENSYEDNVKIIVKHVNKAPIANAGPDQSVNEGVMVTLFGSSSFDLDNESLTYQWVSPNGIVISSAQNANPTFKSPEVQKDTTFTFSLVVNDGQANSEISTVNIKVKQVNKRPEFNSSPNLIAEAGFEYVYLIEVKDEDSLDKINIAADWLPSWLKLIDNGNRTATLKGIPPTNQTLFGKYKITLSATDGLVSEKIKQSFTIELNWKNEFTQLPVLSFDLFPNPTSDYLNVAFNSKLNESTKIELYNSQGQLCIQKESTSANVQFDVSKLTTGVYVLKVMNSNNSISRKVIIN